MKSGSKSHTFAEIRDTPRCPRPPPPRKRKSAKAVSGDVLAKLLASCRTDGLRDTRDRAILMVAFASGARRRSEIAGLRWEQLSVEPPITVEDGPPLPFLAIHLGRTKTSRSEHDEVVYLTGRPVAALSVWIAGAKIEDGSIFRKIDRWGNISKRALEPSAINQTVKGSVAKIPLMSGRAPKICSGIIDERFQVASFSG